jgi:hypothetical protein
MSDSAHDGDQAIPIMEKLHSGFGRELLPKLSLLHPKEVLLLFSTGLVPGVEASHLTAIGYESQE